MTFEEWYAWAVIFIVLICIGFGIGFMVSNRICEGEKDTMRRRCYNNHCECRCHDEVSYV